MDYDVTPEARIGLMEILEYLSGEFGARFSDSYYTDFEHILFIASTQPEGFPIASKRKYLRKLVFRKRTNIYYQMIDCIKVIAIIDNRQDYKVE